MKSLRVIWKKSKEPFLVQLFGGLVVLCNMYVVDLAEWTEKTFPFYANADDHINLFFNPKN